MGSGVEVELAWPTGWLGLGSLVEPKPDPPTPPPPSPIQYT